MTKKHVKLPSRLIVKVVFPINPFHSLIPDNCPSNSSADMIHTTKFCLNFAVCSTMTLKIGLYALIQAQGSYRQDCVKFKDFS